MVCRAVGEEEGTDGHTYDELHNMSNRENSRLRSTDLDENELVQQNLSSHVNNSHAGHYNQSSHHPSLSIDSCSQWSLLGILADC